MLNRLVVEPFLNLGVRIYAFFIERWHDYYLKNPRAARRVGAQVISVGNITWGGTGKTPLVIMLARILSARGKRVAVLTRGYGQDELYELKNSLTGVPILVGRDRIKTAHTAVRDHKAEIILLDDGFQHRRLYRNCDVVAINAADPFGNGHLIPRGNLREPLDHLKRASLFVITKASLGRHNVNFIRQKVREIKPDAMIFEADHKPLRFMNFADNRPVRLEIIRGKKVALLSGIEDPASFERSLNRLGADVVYAARFDDHHAFSRRELKEVLAAAREVGARYLVTTAKDYYRLSPTLEKTDTGDIKVLVLQIMVRMDDHSSFVRQCLA